MIALTYGKLESGLVTSEKNFWMPLGYTPETKGSKQACPSSAGIQLTSGLSHVARGPYAANRRGE